MKRPLRTGGCCSCTYNKVIGAESRSRRLGLVVNLGAGTRGQTQSAYPKISREVEVYGSPTLGYPESIKNLEKILGYSIPPCIL